MPSETHPTRVRYYTGQFLQADDLNDDQTYHRQVRWRHNLALHSWGIVAGLEVDVGGNNVTISPGMALDGYGRELMLAFQEPHSMNGRSKSDAWDIWLIYRSNEWKSSSNRNGCPGTMHSERYQERPLIQFRRRRELTSIDPSRPNEVPPGDLDFGPNDPLPLTQEQQWPVFLGKLIWRDNIWQLDASERRYAGLIAEQVVGPKFTGDEDSYTLLVNGKVPELAEYPFAVVEKKKKKKDGSIQNEEWELGYPWLGVRVTPGEGERIEWNASRAIVSGNLTMLDGAALEFLPTPYSPDPQDTGDLDRWLMYHDFLPPKGPTEDDPDQKKEPFSDELRINIPNSTAGKKGRNSFVVGTNPDGKGFVPILRVRENQTVEVYGDLVVEGRLEGTPTVVPGTGSGIPSVETVLGYLKQHLDQAAESSQANLVELQEKAINKLIEDGRQAQFAEALVKNTSDAFTQPVASQVWTKSAWRIKLGEQAATDSGEFTEFLSSLSAQTVKPIGDWIFNHVPAADYGKYLAVTFPPKSNGGLNEVLKEFATELCDPNNKERLDALLEALIDADSGTPGTLVVNVLWDYENGQKAIIKKVESTAEGRNQISDRLLRTHPGRDALIAAMKKFTSASATWPNYPPSGDPDAWPPAPTWVPNQSLGRLLFERIDAAAGTISVHNPDTGDDADRSFKHLIKTLAELIT